MDYIGNKYVPGNLNSGNGNHEFDSNGNNDDPTDQSNNCIGGNPCDNPGPPSLYLVNNLGPHNSSVTTSPNDSGQKAMTSQGGKVAIAAARYPEQLVPQLTASGRDVPDSGGFGQRPGQRDAEHRRQFAASGLQRQLRQQPRFAGCARYRSVQGGRSGNFFTGQFSAPSIASGSSACTESQHDGIPDQWKQRTD